MANGQQKSQDNINRFELWMASMNDEAYMQIVNRGKLSRTDIAKSIGFSKSVLRQNPTVSRLLSKLEDDLRYRGVLPSLVARDASSDHAKQYDQGEVKRPFVDKQLNALEKENIELKARVASLEKELSKHKELGETIIELGLLPNA